MVKGHSKEDDDKDERGGHVRPIAIVLACIEVIAAQRRSAFHSAKMARTMILYSPAAVHSG